MAQTLTQIRNIFRDKDIRLRKRWGQNLLIDSNILRSIVQSCELSPHDIVIEIGPGTGVLTEILANTAKQVIAIDIDERMIQVGRNLLQDSSNIQWVHQDILKTDLQGYLNKYNRNILKVVGNLPYYITTPVLMRFLEEKFPFERFVVTIQKEVAKRIVASPGTKEYGVLSLMVQYRCKCELIKVVSKNCFYPIPDVDSAIVRLVPHPVSPVQVSNEELLFSLIRGVFKQRRKTLRNSLFAIKDTLKLSRLEINDVINMLNVDARIRGERLSLEDYARLANLVTLIKKKK